MNPFLIGLVGDSDIARWPSPLLPNISSLTNTPTDDTTSGIPNVIVSGHPGMTLNQIVPHVQDAIVTLLQSDLPCTAPTNKFLVVCGGENDIGCGIPMCTSKLAFQSLLDLVQQTNVQQVSKRQHASSFQPSIVHLIFLGPKLEPWLRHDSAARKSYIQMSIIFEQLCHQQRRKDIESKSVQYCDSDIKYIHYIDCLTMFCGNCGTNRKSALYGGKDTADTIYFHSDQLHLSNDGYEIWKSAVEDKIATILSAS